MNREVGPSLTSYPKNEIRFLSPSFPEHKWHSSLTNVKLLIRPILQFEIIISQGNDLGNGSVEEETVKWLQQSRKEEAQFIANKRQTCSILRYKCSLSHSNSYLKVNVASAYVFLVT